MPAEDEVEVELARAGWPLPSQAQREIAREAVERRLEDAAGAARALARFYDPAGPYAGRTYLDLPPVEPDRLTLADFLAVTLLDVTVRPPAIRRFLEHGTQLDEVVKTSRGCRETLTSRLQQPLISSSQRTFTGQ